MTITGLLPVPTNIAEDARIRLSKLVDCMLDAKMVDAEANTAALENEIDELAYRLYGLRPDEIRLVEASAPFAKVYDFTGGHRWKRRRKLQRLILSAPHVHRQVKSC